jgi:hypothetical protein
MVNSCCSVELPLIWPQRLPRLYQLDRIGPPESSQCSTKFSQIKAHSSGPVGREQTSSFYQKLRSEDCPSDTNLMAIVIKLEDSEFGDSFMHISRTYDDIIEKNRKNPNRCDTGTPMFLIAMAGMSLRYLSL